MGGEGLRGGGGRPTEACCRAARSLIYFFGGALALPVFYYCSCCFFLSCCVDKRALEKKHQAGRGLGPCLQPLEAVPSVWGGGCLHGMWDLVRVTSFAGSAAQATRLPV